MWSHHNGYDGSGMHDAMAGGGWLMLIVLLLLLATVVGTTVGVVLWSRAGHDADPGPRKLLAERYALGEIDDEEYGRRLKVLGGS